MKWWHRWRAAVWARKLPLLDYEVAMLEKTAREYLTSYYEDQLFAARVRRLEAASWHRYHDDKVAHHD